VLNDRDDIAGVKRKFQRPVISSAADQAACADGANTRAGCSLWVMGGRDWLTTLSISTQYMGGNLRPSLNFFYDWSRSYSMQPGLNWTFWDPFRASVRYNYIEGRGNRGIGTQNRKDNIWFELQYLLY